MAMLDCELTSEVTYFCEQPATLEFDACNGFSRYRPDLLRIRNGAVELIEVKPEALASSPENEARWRAIGAAVATIGLTFAVLTEIDLEAEPRWGNLNAVWRDRLAKRPGPGPTREIQAMLRRSLPMTTDAILSLFPTIERRAVHAMIRHGDLLANFGATPVTVSAPVPGRVYPLRQGAI